MEELFNLGISLTTLSSMYELNPEIKDMSNSEVKEKIAMLKLIKCSDNQIVNIITSNSLYLNKTKEEYLDLINYLTRLNFNTLNILFDSNPYILNLEPYEIENYINKKIQNGELLENIVDELDSTPYLFNEI